MKNAIHRVFTAVVSDAIKTLGKVSKAAGDDKVKQILDALDEQFQNLPAAITPSLVDAILSGISDGAIQLTITDTDMIAEANTVARDWAKSRAAELVGMRYNEDDELVPNPNAEWQIADSTRDDIRDIISDAFEHDTTMDDLSQQLQDSTSFSEARADMIARTETMNAQIQGNVDIWTKTGTVKTIQWFCTDDEPCDECDMNDEEIVPFGDEFPSGDRFPTVHPNCKCIVAIHELTDEEDE